MVRSSEVRVTEGSLVVINASLSDLEDSRVCFNPFAGVQSVTKS